MIKKLVIAGLFVMVSSLTMGQSGPIVTDSTSRSATTSINETAVKSLLPIAVAPAIFAINSDIRRLEGDKIQSFLDYPMSK